MFNTAAINKWIKPDSAPFYFGNERRGWLKRRNVRIQRKYRIQAAGSKVALYGIAAGWKFEKPKAFDMRGKVEPKNAAAVALLDSWLSEDAGDQQETWQYLMKAIDENRLSNRKLFS